MTNTTFSAMFLRAVGVLMALPLAMTSCGRGKAAPPPMAADAVEAKRLIAQQCPMPPAPQSLSGEARAPRVFVEIARLEALPGESLTLGRVNWRDDPRVAVTRVAHVMTTSGVAATVPWDAEGGTAEGAPCNGVDRSDLSITTQVSANGAEPLRLDIRIEPAPPLGQSKETWHVPEHRTTHTTVLLQDQQLVTMALGRQPSKNPSIVIVMPYVVRDDGDMRRLFECKMQAATRARQPPTLESRPQSESIRGSPLGTSRQF